MRLQAQVEYDYIMQLFDSIGSDVFATEMSYDSQTAAYHFDYICTASTSVFNIGLLYTKILQ